MATLGKEVNTCFGRGFDAGGFMGKLYAWITKTQANHGPGWYIIDDQSTAGTNPYIVVSDKSAPSANSSRAKIIQIILPTATSGRVQFSYWNWWNASTHVGVGPAGQAYFISFVPTLDSATFSYHFEGGAELLFIGTLTGLSTVVDWTFIDEWSYISDDYCKAESEFGTLQNPLYVESGDSTNQLSGYENITGAFANLDANGALYFSVVNTTGTTFRIDIYKDSARTLLIGHTATFTNTATGAKSITADNSSGLGGNITTTATATASVAISCTMNRITVGSGEGAGFAVNDWVYITDYSQTNALASYVQITAKTGDVLVLGSVPGKGFSSGSLIGAYPHRFHLGTNWFNGTGSSGTIIQTVPYVSYQGQEFGSPPINSGANDRRSQFFGLSTVQSPGDSLKYQAMRPIIAEQYWFNQSSTNMNREYGQAKNFMIGPSTSMTKYIHGRTINSKDWLYIADYSGGFAMMLNTTESAS